MPFAMTTHADSHNPIKSNAMLSIMTVTTALCSGTEAHS
ncbi:hypothetical protein GGD68_005904 [Paraburkholderia fungorum]|uniref:Uncharacterized protein n=1 Tax=Paraburkholderia fungorum TaxID=134537 RepID=A0AAW3V2X4_9BURK|nr:hypothetical protein [Paraburkholderia fungorum]MBB5545554.1 hypothetical protein [Paraburkholderia fungorum]MBB6205269.1 hypothetical protein [Paraburkholderia fungorum]PRZ53285.1 hypothetical protein BX589_111207 [Paraburkholderia fungorum]